MSLIQSFNTSLSDTCQVSLDYNQSHRETLTAPQSPMSAGPPTGASGKLDNSSRKGDSAKCGRQGYRKSQRVM